MPKQSKITININNNILMTSQSCLYSSVKLQKRRNYNERAHASVHACEYRDNALPPRVLTYFFSVFCIILTNISNVKITQVRHCCANCPWFDSTRRHYFILFYFPAISFSVYSLSKNATSDIFCY